MRRHKAEAHENHERWLVSYADFITLLFAFFVVMFASGRTDRVRAKQISQAVQTALGSSSQKADMKGKADGQTPAPLDLESSMDILRKELAPEIDDGKVQLKLEARGLIVGLSAASFFPSGADVIDPGSYHTIAKVATVLNKLPNALRLEGHTDS